MRLLITGATGFIASRLILRLREEGYETWGLQRYVAGRVPDLQTVLADITDAEVEAAIERVAPDVILHLAALASNEQANANPAEVMRVNAVGTQRVVNGARRLRSHPWLVLASSSEVYGYSTGQTKEDHPVIARNPYAASKIAAEQAVRASECPFIIARPFNTYGRAFVHLPKFVVDEAIVTALTQHKVVLRNPAPLRDFVFREDHVDAYLRIVAYIERGGPPGETFNFGTGSAWSIGHMGLMVASLLGCAAPEFQGGVRLGDIDRLQADASKAGRVLGWLPQYTLEEGLKLAIAEWSTLLQKVMYAGR